MRNSMTKSYIFAVLSLAVVLMTSIWMGSRGLSVEQSTDHNVPGATTGKGRTSLMD